MKCGWDNNHPLDGTAMFLITVCSPEKYLHMVLQSHPMFLVSSLNVFCRAYRKTSQTLLLTMNACLAETILCVGQHGHDGSV